MFLKRTVVFERLKSLIWTKKYLQAQNAGAKFVFGPGGLQHLTDELQLNQHIYFSQFNGIFLLY